MVQVALWSGPQAKTPGTDPLGSSPSGQFAGRQVGTSTPTVSPVRSGPDPEHGSPGGNPTSILREDSDPARVATVKPSPRESRKEHRAGAWPPSLVQPTSQLTILGSRPWAFPGQAAEKFRQVAGRLPAGYRQVAGRLPAGCQPRTCLMEPLYLYSLNYYMSYMLKLDSK